MNKDIMSKEEEKKVTDRINELYHKKVKEGLTPEEEAERKELYDIIKTSEDEGKIQWAKDRIQELDRIKEKEVNGHNEFLKEEREKTDRNITGGMLLLAVSAGLISNKQVRQMGGKAISSVGKGLLRLKK